jgi:hypothetical protein
MEKRDVALIAIGVVVIGAGFLYIRNKQGTIPLLLPAGAGLPAASASAFTLQSSKSADGFDEIDAGEKLKAWKALYALALIPIGASAKTGATSSAAKIVAITENPLAVAPLPANSPIEKTAAYILAAKNMNLSGKHFVLARIVLNDVVFWPVSQGDAENNAAVGGDWKLFLRPDEAWTLTAKAGIGYAMNVKIS